LYRSLRAVCLCFSAKRSRCCNTQNYTSNTDLVVSIFAQLLYTILGTCESAVCVQSESNWALRFESNLRIESFQLQRILITTRNTLDCDQSNYSSCIVFSHIPIEFGETGNSAIRSADLENTTVEPNMKWIGRPLVEIWPFEIFHM